MVGGELGAQANVIFELNSFHLGLFGIVHSNTASTGKAYFGDDELKRDNSKTLQQLYCSFKTLKRNYLRNLWNWSVMVNSSEMQKKSEANSCEANLFLAMLRTTIIAPIIPILLYLIWDT